MILVHNFKTGTGEEKGKIYKFYLKSTRYINNWDLVDLSAPKIVGEYLLTEVSNVSKANSILTKLARSQNLWERRIAIVATYQFIINNRFDKTWEIAKSARLFVGFNNMDFDLRFIYQRSVVCGTKPSVDLSFARYRSNPIYDVMHEWNKWDIRSHISLDGLAKALGIPSSKGGVIEGKDVAQAFKDGRLAEICDYCKKNVEVTRIIYQKMTFGTQSKLPF